MEARADGDLSDGAPAFKDFSNPEVPLPSIAGCCSSESNSRDGLQSAAVLETAWGRFATADRAADVPSTGAKMESTDGQDATGTGDALEAEAPADDEALRGRTENNADAYTSSGSACVDFFFQVVHGMDSDKVGELLAAAWGEDANTALRLVFHLRDVREGKGEQAAFYACLRWLRRNHPRTLIANLRHVAAVGYWKDLLELVVLEGVGSRTGAAKGCPEKFDKGKPIKSGGVVRGKAKGKRWRLKGERKELAEEEKEAKKARRELRREMRLAKMKENRLCARKARAIAARAAFQSDALYQAIHVEVARLFATALQADLEKFQDGKSVSLAAKWAPSLECTHDKRSHIASTIACMLFPRQEEGMRARDWGSYVYKARDRYRKEVLVPLRRHLDVTEVKMSGGEWDKIDYGRVASVCMNSNKGHFAEHDGERFAAYLGDVKEGKAKIAAGALMPHQLVQQVIRNAEKAMVSACLEGDEDDVDMGQEGLCMETVELQWKEYVSKLRGAGVLDGALAICDVSGSMDAGDASAKPLEVAVALSLLVSEVTEPPFGGLVCTFSGEPELVSVRLEDSLADKVRDMRGMNWGFSTNLEAVFNLILERARASSLPADRMIRRLFVFSDMEFDQAQDGDDQFETTHAAAKRRFSEAGYELPQVVYWNLSGRVRMGGRGASAPVLKEEEGCSLISGFSGQLLKAFMGEGGLDKFRPHSMMMAAAQRYGHLAVLD